MSKQISSYADAGVDINAGDRFVDMIRSRIKRAWPSVAKEIGGFAGAWNIPRGVRKGYSGADGTGTKAIVAALFGKFHGLGIDAVAMSAVDTYVAGARPRYILDVLGVAKLNPELHIKIIESVIEGCQLAGCTLIGGETAEQPDLYRHAWMVDVNTFCIGFPEPELRPKRVRPGQLVYGWPSNGLGSNGFSLLRKVFGWDRNYDQLRQEYAKNVLMGVWVNRALTPTPIWIKEIDSERRRGVMFTRHAHITGGGIPGNVPRILPDDCQVVIDRSAWHRPTLFSYLQERAGIAEYEMNRTFNQGIMVVSIVDPKGRLPEHPDIRCIGEVVQRPKFGNRVIYRGAFEE